MNIKLLSVKMPTHYNFDRSVVPDPNAAYYSNTPVANATAFSTHAPKALPGLFAPAVPNDILSKIPMPNGQDHGWGQHNATFTVKVLPTTPFNNFLKGDPTTPFRVPVGRPSRQSDDVDAQPRTEFMIRVKRIIDYLKTLNSPQLSTPPLDAYTLNYLNSILEVLTNLYANLNGRLPTSKEISDIEAVELLMTQYLQSVSSVAPAAVGIVPLAPGPPGPGPGPGPQPLPQPLPVQPQPVASAGDPNMSWEAIPAKV